MPVWASLSAKDPISKMTNSKFEAWTAAQSRAGQGLNDDMLEGDIDGQLKQGRSIVAHVRCTAAAWPAQRCAASNPDLSCCPVDEQALASDLLHATQVYVLCIPKRRAHAERLMQRWGFHEAEFVEGPDKSKVDLEACMRDGLVTAEYEDVIYEDAEYSPQGKVACHLGHLNILRRLIDRQDKSYAIIFEDDLEDKLHYDDNGQPLVMRELLDFLARVPRDFDLVHLGFVRESRQERLQMDEDALVFRSAEALGRHAYMLTKGTAQLLLDHTLPMYNHGDKMFQLTYRQHGLKAYQPRDPLFYQDRVHFESELTEKWKPSRAFQPTEDDDGIRDCDREEMLRRQQLPRKAESMLDAQPTAALFLEVDGVLNASSSPSVQPGRPQIPHLAKLHALLAAATPGGRSCVLVLTTRWRFDAPWCRRFSAAVARSGVPRNLLTAAPSSTGGDQSTHEERIREIMEWLAVNGWVRTWAVIDTMDFSTMGRHQVAERSVRTDPERGLQEADVDAVLSIMRRRPHRAK